MKVVIEAQTAGLTKEISGIKKQLGGLQSETNRITSGMTSAFKKLIGAVIALKIGEKIGQAIFGGIKDAMKVESSIQQIQRLMGESTNAFLKWANTQALAFNMSKTEALSYGATYSNLVTGFSKSNAETMQYTEDLLKSSSIVASATGRTMQDVMERIRSGILGNTEAIEDLGIYAQVGAIQATAAFKKLANGKTWDQLDYQTQQQIRVMSILEQTTKKYGDAVLDNTASRLQQLVAVLNNVKLNIGQAFMPVVNIVLPILTALASKLEYVTNVIAQFSQALFGKSSSGKQTKGTNSQAAAVSGLGNAYDAAGKKAKKAQGFLAGFDEVNSISDSASNDDAGAGAAGMAGTAGMAGEVNFDTNAPEISEKVQAMANRVKAAVADMSRFIQQHKDVIVSALAGMAAAFIAFQVITNWTKIVEGLAAAWGAVGSAITVISAPILAIAVLIGLLVANIVYLWQTNEGFRDSVIEAWNTIKAVITTIATDTWNVVKNVWDTYGQGLLNALKGFMGSIQAIIISVWESVIKPIIMGALDMLSWLWEKHLKGLIEQVAKFVMILATDALEIWNKFIAPIVGFLIETLGPAFAGVTTLIIDTLGSALAVVIDVAKGLLVALGGVIDFITGVFTGNWSKAWNGVKSIFKGVFDSLYGIVKVPLNLIIDAINWVISGLNRLSITVPDWVSKITGIPSGSKWGFDIPNITKLAKGGITDGPMLAMIGDNPGGKEVVSPLGDLQNLLAAAVVNAMLAAQPFMNQSNNQNGDIVLQMDGTTFARIIRKYTESESNRIGGPMIITT